MNSFIFELNTFSVVSEAIYTLFNFICLPTLRFGYNFSLFKQKCIYRLARIGDVCHFQFIITQYLCCHTTFQPHMIFVLGGLQCTKMNKLASFKFHKTGL